MECLQVLLTLFLLTIGIKHSEATVGAVTCGVADDVAGATKSPTTEIISPNSVTYTCDEGYRHTSGDLTRTCELIGGFSGSAPVCQIVTCSASSISYGSHDKSSFVYLDKVTYQCNTGYFRSDGNLERTCQANGSLSGETPVCSRIHCGVPDTPPHSSKSGSTYYYSYTVTYSCSTGYTLTSGSSSRTCQLNATWSGTPPVCSVVDCGDPGASPNVVKSGTNYTYQSVVKFSCAYGYTQSSGSTSRSCSSSGSWSGSVLTCTAAYCGYTPSVSYATKNASTYMYYPDIVQYTCDPGYVHTAGNLTRTCQPDTSLSGTTPTCTGNCGEAENVTHATKTPTTDVIYPNYVYYTCETGYQRVSGSLSRRCENSGVFSGSIPTCGPKSCGTIPGVSYATRSASSTIYYPNNVTYTCNFGYIHATGNLTRHCEANGVLNGTAPTCQADCGVAPDVEHTSKSPTTNITQNNKVTYACKSGYYHPTSTSSHNYGTLDRTCQYNRQFSGSTPVCYAVSCGYGPTVANADKSPTSARTYPNNVTYTCRSGYVHVSGDLVRSCQADRQFSGIAPLCQRDCGVAPDVANATKSPTTNIIHPYSVNYTCNTGFNHVTGHLVRTCSTNGHLGGSSPTCQIVDCGVPADIINATKSVSASVTYGGKVVYTCIPLHTRVAGLLTRECLASGSFSGTPPVCAESNVLKDNDVNSCILVNSNSSFSYSMLSQRLSSFIFNVYVKNIQCSGFSGITVSIGNKNTCPNSQELCVPMVSSSPTLCLFICHCVNCQTLSITFEMEGLDANSKVCEFVI